MSDYHPYTTAYCVSCHSPDGECTGVKASDIDLGRVVSDKALADIREVVGVGHESGTTVAELIRAEAGIGYGGHFDETSDDEDNVLGIAALDDRELNGMHAARHEYTSAVRDAVDAVEWPARSAAPLRCDRHGGPWGDDETCPRCTYPSGRVRPPLDDPGPLREEP